MPNTNIGNPYFFLQAHLEIEVPNYYAENDPLLTYSTPLHDLEEHTTTREELIGKVKTTNGDGTEEAADETSNGSNESDVKSWSLDHAYLPNEIVKIFCDVILVLGFSKVGFVWGFGSGGGLE